MSNAISTLNTIVSGADGLSGSVHTSASLLLASNDICRLGALRCMLFDEWELVTATRWHSVLLRPIVQC